jgi:hypothetical protein
MPFDDGLQRSPVDVGEQLFGLGTGQLVEVDPAGLGQGAAADQPDSRDVLDEASPRG